MDSELYGFGQRSQSEMNNLDRAIQIYKHSQPHPPPTPDNILGWALLRWSIVSLAANTLKYFQIRGIYCIFMWTEAGFNIGGQMREQLLGAAKLAEW